jgi:hypothetical protein
MISSGRSWLGVAGLAAVLCACNAEPGASDRTSPVAASKDQERTHSDPRPEIYAQFTLTADLTGLSPQQRSMLGVLIDASKVMDELFWRQAYGDDYRTWLDGLSDANQRQFAEWNYGPWDRLAAERPFIKGVGAKPLGANFYPADMTRQEFEELELADKTGLYSLIRRDQDGSLVRLAYHQVYAEELQRAAELLLAAAELAEHDGFANYLRLRATALVTDQYQASDLAWMDVKTNPVELVIGAIETYEDRLFGYRAGYESYVLLKDQQWSRRLAHVSAFLPGLQRGLPVADQYKAESPGGDSDLNVYDVLYYAGHSNAGSKTIAINLPNDEQVQLQKGTRRLQLKNAMRAKFDKILKPIAAELIDGGQRKHVSFEAFFANTMFHEVAHGLGIKNTIDGKSTVREALREIASSMEEGKADILGLYMISVLHETGELDAGDLRDNYVTFMAGLFRSIRFGASVAHGKANMIRFNFFATRGAFVRDADSGKYSVDFDRMRAAIDELSALLLTLQGDGDYPRALELTETMGRVGPQLQSDLERLTNVGIPVDIVFKQGKVVLGLD